MNIVTLLFSYFIGSINFAYIVAKFKKIDISTKGSGNPGTSNVMRIIGKQYAAIVLIGDMLKGFLPIYISLDDEYFLIYGLSAILGHIFPIYYKFKGGKGVATFFGIYLAVLIFHPNNFPEYFQSYILLSIGFIIGCYYLIFKLTRVSAVASLSTVAISITILIVANNGFINIMTLTAILFLIFFKHKDNIKRLIKGQENKF